MTEIAVPAASAQVAPRSAAAPSACSDAPVRPAPSGIHSTARMRAIGQHGSSRHVPDGGRRTAARDTGFHRHHEPRRHRGIRGVLDAGAPFRVHGADLIRAAAADLAAGGVPPAVIAARFHNGVAAAVEAACLRLRERHGLATVALSGGVFQNVLLLNQVVTRLESREFTVLTHSRVPCNDGGISLGQAVIAIASDRAGSATAP